ncbi:MAG: SemiSWEET transporter [Candidatus Omnitrophota bacterium]|nr:SemiSWEET transporter [Candidatus Omnitrophota bacterium]
MLWTIIGSSAAVLTMFGFIPQIIKVLKNKSAKDVSLITLIQLSLGVSLWIAYGIHLKDAIIIVANSITLITLVILLCLYCNYRRRTIRSKDKFSKSKR